MRPDSVKWFPLALVAAVLYGLHNVFTRLASGRIDDHLGGLVLEGTATLAIGAYLLVLRARGVPVGHWTPPGILHTVLAGLCVGVGTVLFFVLFRIGAPLSTAGPMILGGGITVMALAGVALFGEPMTMRKALGFALTLAGAILLKTAQSAD